MIPLLTQVIREHPEWLRYPHAPLSFMKVSTPASGRGMDKGKVLLFVFEHGELAPSLCIKTTRVYSARDVIRRNHDNLKLLQEGVYGSECSGIFARPLYLSDNRDLIFCVESVCPGVIFSAKMRSIELVIAGYGAWQSHLARTVDKVFRAEDIANLACDTIRALGLSEKSTQEMYNYFNKLPLDRGTRLPALVQHGDMTPDNVLVSGDSIYLIDYDSVGVSQIPGFDLFNFLSKLKSRVGSFRSNCDRYLPPYFQNIGADIKLYESILFIYYLQEIHRKGNVAKGKSGHDIVEDFMILMDR